jgi:hypothetical protein
MEFGGGDSMGANGKLFYIRGQQMAISGVEEGEETSPTSALETS